MTRPRTPGNPMAQDFTLIPLLRFAFPTIATMLFMGLYTMTDTIFISRLVNTNALSAVNIVCPVINIMVGLGTMTATGGSAIIARRMGEGQERQAKQDFTLIVLFGAFLGILVAVTGLFFLDHIIWGLGATDMLFPYCKDYLRILLLFAPASMLQTLFQNLTVTAGRPSLGLSLSVGAGIINIILDYLFMAVLGMGVMGAALGTGIGYVIPASIGILFFSGKNGTLSFVRPSLRLSVLAKSCANGSSEMVSQISSAVTTFFFNRAMLKMLGENGVAAITIIIYAQFLLTTLYIGFSMGVAPVISFNYGAGNLLRLKNICRICLRFIAVSSACIFLSSLLFGPRLVHLFPGSETLVYDIAAPGFVLFSFSFLFSGMNIFSSATFTALSNGRISALISFFRTFGLIMLCLLILPALIGVNGVWLAVPVAELLTFGVSAYFLHSCREKYSLGG